MSNINISQPSVKISEFEPLSDALLKNCEVAAIASDNIDNINNYRLKLSNFYYTKVEVDNAISKVKLQLLRELNAIEIPEEYDDTALSALINDYTRHISGLKNGIFVDNVQSTEPSVEGSNILIFDKDNDGKNDLSLTNLKNVLYKTVDSNKVLISNHNGKLETSNITVDELNALGGIKSNIQTQLNNLETKIKQLETKLNNNISSLTSKINDASMVPNSVKMVQIKLNSAGSGTYNPSTNGYILTGFWKWSGEVYINGKKVAWGACGGRSHNDWCTIPVKKGSKIEFIGVNHAYWTPCS